MRFLDEAVVKLEVSSGQSLITVAALDFDEVAHILKMGLEFLWGSERLAACMASSVFCAF